MEMGSIVVGIIGFVAVLGMFCIVMSFFEKDYNIPQFKPKKSEQSYRLEFEEQKESEDCSVILIDE